MKIKAIVACDNRGGIGKDGDIPWHIPEDFKHFKDYTLGKAVLMGRKTYESIGRLLPKRINIIVSRDPAFEVNRAVNITDMDEFVKHIGNSGTMSELIVMGGAEIYNHFAGKYDEVVVTRINGTFECDTKIDLDHLTNGLVREKITSLKNHEDTTVATVHWYKKKTD